MTSLTTRPFPVLAWHSPLRCPFCHRRHTLNKNKDPFRGATQGTRGTQFSVEATGCGDEAHDHVHNHVHNHHHHHGCCGDHPVGALEGNPLHDALSKWLSSLRLISFIEALRHRRIGTAIAIMGLLCYLSPWSTIQQPFRSIGMAIVLCLSGLPLFKSALLQICRLDVRAATLMSLSALGSIYVGMAGEGLMLLVLLQMAHLLDSKFTNQSRTSLQSLLDAVPDRAAVIQMDSGNGKPDMDSVRMWKASEVAVGTRVVVKPGEAVPLDGIVVDGSASMTVEHISGESLPVLARPGSQVAAGSLNIDGLLVVKTIATIEDSTPRRIAQLTMEAQAKKPAVHRWIDDVTTVWSKCALLVAASVAFGCVLVGVPFLGARGALYRSLCIVTAAAPCALVMTPLAYVCALANASQRSILIKSAAVLDALHRCSFIALDKTGTLTMGRLVCTNIVNGHEDISGTVAGTPSKHRALCHAVDLSKRSSHPVAHAIVEAGKQHLPPRSGNCTVSDFELVPGYGVRGTIIPRTAPPVYANFGSLEFIQQQLELKQDQSDVIDAVDAVRDRLGNIFSVLTTGDQDGRNLEWSAFCFRDELQSLSHHAVMSLQSGAWKGGKPHKAAKKQVAIVTGDNAASAQSVGDILEVTDILSDQKPIDKLQFVQSKQSTDGTTTKGVVMVGDGINDAPALAQADVGISISDTACDLSATASDIVLLNGQGVANLPYLFRLADRLRNIIIQNLILSFSAMAIVCLPSLRGWMPLWLAVIVHEGCTVLTAVNSCRLLFIRHRHLRDTKH